MDESCHTLWTSHVTHCERVMSHVMDESCQTWWTSHVTNYGRVMSHIMNESCHTLWTSHDQWATHTDWNADFGEYEFVEKSCHTLWTSLVTHYRRVMSHILDGSWLECRFWIIWILHESIRNLHEIDYFFVLLCFCSKPNRYTLRHTTSHCHTLQHTATHCITLPHTATHCITLQ